MGKKDEGFLSAVRNLRDIGMEAWAKAALQITATDTYGRLSKLTGAPGLIATGVMRASTEKTMSLFLGQLNLPSRADVLALSSRLTHIEMVLDDLGAALDRLQPAAAPKADQGARPGIRAVGVGES